MEEQLFNILDKLVVKNNIQLNQDELKLQLLSHPSYPSMHALTGVLDHFNVSNLAVRLSVNLETLAQLPPCFIAVLKGEQGQELVLVEMKNGRTKIVRGKRKSVSIGQKDFVERWTGIILAIEKDENIVETTGQPVFSMLKNASILLACPILGYFLFTNANMFSLLHFVLSLAGLGLSLIVMQHELGVQSSISNNFCNLSERSSCDAVLNSKGATLFGLFKLSDLSLVAFGTYVVNWFFVFITGAADATLLALLTLFSLPFVFYSIYYQFGVVKRWCPFCLGIVAVLLLQVATLPLGQFPASITIEGYLLLGSSLLIVLGLWSFIKPLLEKKESLQKMEVEHLKFKRDFSIFYALFKGRPVLGTSPSISGEIVLGNENAALEIILITNPLCHYCKEAHREVEGLLERAKGQVKVIVRFSIDIANKSGEGYQIAEHLLDVYKQQGKQACRKALSQVFQEDTVAKQWLEARKNPPSQSYAAILNQHTTWCSENDINFTPVVYVNKTQLPIEYEISDLFYFIEDLSMPQARNPNLVDSILLPLVK